MSKIDRLHKSFPQFYNTYTNQFLKALIEVIGESDDNIVSEIQTAKDQIFITLASGQYLEALGHSYGVPRNIDINPDDDTYRKLISTMTFSPKQVRKTIYDIVDTFWSPLYTRANVQSNNAETFDLSANLSTLLGTLTFYDSQTKVTGNGTFFTSSLQIGDYIKLSNKPNSYYYRVAKIVNDTELVISEKFYHSYDQYTIVSYRPHNIIIENDIEQVNIIINPTQFNDLSAVTNDELITFFKEKHPTIAGMTIFDAFAQRNLLNIRTNTIGLKGYIYVVGGTLNNILDFPTNKSVFFDINQRIELYEINANEITIKLPAEMPTIRRSLRGSSHFKDWGGTIVSVDNILKQIVVNLNVAVIDNYYANKKFSQELQEFIIVSHLAGQNDIILNFGPLDDLSGINTSYKFEIIDTATKPYNSSFLYDPNYATSNTRGINFPYTVFKGDIIGMNPINNDGYENFPIHDIYYAQYGATSLRCKLNQNISTGDVIIGLSVVDASDIPNSSGYLIINKGLDNEESFVKYSSVPNNSIININPFYVFTKDHLVGEIISFMNASACVPSANGQDLGSFTIDSTQARIYVQQLIQQVVAAGIKLRFLITIQKYPHSSLDNNYLY